MIVTQHSKPRPHATALSGTLMNNQTHAENNAPVNLNPSHNRHDNKPNVNINPNISIPNLSLPNFWLLYLSVFHVSVGCRVCSALNRIPFKGKRGVWLLLGASEALVEALVPVMMYGLSPPSSLEMKTADNP